MCSHWTKFEKTQTIMNVSIPLLLHGNLKAAVQDFVECVDPILHLSFTVCSQQVGALILHLQLKCKSPNLVVLQGQHKRGLEKTRKGGTGRQTLKIRILWKTKKVEQRLFVIEKLVVPYLPSVLISDIEKLIKFSFSHLKIKYPAMDTAGQKEYFISLAKANTETLPTHQKAVFSFMI